MMKYKDTPYIPQQFLINYSQQSQKDSFIQSVLL